MGHWYVAWEDEDGMMRRGLLLVLLISSRLAAEKMTFYRSAE
jgi:hypothetical protein